ncbi:PRKR-interacting protein 1 homolog [Drosophila teissieri]|uniref:PRKR-interacting protein 1 homolog n=1 Tax=Drosophila teissieri TaxID=7243 RepID=UPI001CBA25AA|nr:PRKR-interacting protein 1 homolog [Drosophila teissieri]
MSLIKNLVKEPEKKPKKKKKDAGSGESDSDEKDKPLRPFIKTATDLQRLKLEKLMKNPDKPVVIPEQRRERDFMSSVPTFVRNVMGSSAGAGSGEFHVYRHLRRKEYARQKNIQNQSAREAADDAFQQKLDDNRRAAEEKTAKKRAKRMKKKQRVKKPKEDKKPVANEASEASNSDSEEEHTEEKAESNPKEDQEVASKESKDAGDNTEKTPHEEAIDSNTEAIRTESTARSAETSKPMGSESTGATKVSQNVDQEQDKPVP